MKRLKVMLGVLIFASIWSDVFSQGYKNQVMFETIRPRPISVTFLKTTNLIFPVNIEDVDYGSSGIIVQQRKGAKNILHVKAAKRDFEQTSLSVITKDGAFYSFLVNYASDVGDINFVCSQEPGNLASVAHNETELEMSASAIEKARPFLHKKQNVEFSSLALQGLYLSDQTLWMKLDLANYSFVDFPVGYVKFFLEDKKRVKRQVVQEKEIFPVYMQVPDVVDGKTHESFIIGFDPFSIPKRQLLVVQIGEKTEARTLELKIRPKVLFKARKI